MHASTEKLPKGKNRCPVCQKVHDIDSCRIPDAPPKDGEDAIGRAAFEKYLAESGIGMKIVHLRCPHCGTTYNLTYLPDGNQQSEPAADKPQDETKMKVLYEKNGVPVAVWVPKREYGIPDASDQLLLRFIVTSYRIHAWVRVLLGSTEIRTILAFMPGVFRSPELGMTPPPPIPFRHHQMIFLSAPKDFAEKIHIMGDQENDDIPDPSRKFIRPGLWFSPSVAGGTLIGCQDSLYIVPDNRIETLGNDLQTEGTDALKSLESFPDPTVGKTDDKGVIEEPRDRKSCFIASACYGSAYAPEVHILRTYRDARLTRHTLGRLLVSCYETVSPPIAAFIVKKPLLRALLRSILVKPMVTLAATRLKSANKPIQETLYRAPDR